MNYGFSRYIVTFLIVVTICQMGSSLRNEGRYLGSWFQKGCRASWEEAMKQDPEAESHCVWGEETGLKGQEERSRRWGRSEGWCFAGLLFSSLPSRMPRHELVLPTFKGNLSEKTFIDTLRHVPSQVDREEEPSVQPLEHWLQPRQCSLFSGQQVLSQHAQGMVEHSLGTH